MNLVIVESPAKAKTINKYLGKDYKVLASYGHIRDLPSKNGSVDPENNFQMLWEIDAFSKKYLKEITDTAVDSKKIILATDPDREGEAIAWHVKEVLDQKKLDLTIATPGDHGQPQTIFQILNFIYKNQISLQRAIDFPRIRHNNGNKIFVEKGFNKNFYLDKKNFSIKVFKKKNRLFGGVTAIKVNSNKTLSRGADKRRNCY